LVSLAEAATAVDDDENAVSRKTDVTPRAGTSTPRVTKVARREGLPPVHLQPRAPGPTEAQQAERITALQNQIRYTFAIQPHILRRHLRNNHWNVIEAADAFWEEEEAARNHNTLPELWYDLPMARTVENSRLHARTALRRRLNAGTNNTDSLPHSNTALLGLLQRNQWVLDNAEADYHANKGDLDDITDAYSSLRTPRPSAMEQDARIAAFVSLTSTNSIYAARQHLVRHNWDYARAVDAWRRSHGLPEDCAPKRRNSKGVVQETEPNDGLRYHNANHPPYSYSAWRESLGIPDDDEVSTSASSSSIDVSESSLEELDAGSNIADKPSYEDSKHKGYLIEYDRRPAMVNCPDASKLRVEMVQKGKYKMVFFKGQEERPRNSAAPRRRFRWHDEDLEDGKLYIEFDWTNPDHIHQLNDWRQQFHRRQSAITVKPPSVQYHPLEEHFLWQQHAEHLEETVGEGRIDPSDGDSYPLRVTHARKERWADALNRKFAGQTDVDGVHMSDNPRPIRLSTSIDMARYRMLSIARDFGVNFVQGHGPRRGRGKKYNVGKKLKTVRFESVSDEDETEHRSESEGVDGASEGNSSDSYAEAEAGKRARKEKANSNVKVSKKARRGSGGRGGGYSSG
jgi:UBA-like domain